MTQEYQEFLRSKEVRAAPVGIDRPVDLSPHLFPFQRHCVDFALRAGRSGCFLDTGLGKTEIQLEWMQRVIDHEGGPALLLTPLAVAGQTKRRADRWGYPARVIRSQADVGDGINIINYDRLSLIDPAAFSAVSLDEGSILKSFTGKTTRALMAAFDTTPFKMVATATPAPNDHMELGSYSDFLNVLSSNEMLSRFFINDTSQASQAWRLKRHGVAAFWDWMASWARMAERPSDLGDDDAGFNLPPFEVIRHRSRDSKIDAEFADMFGQATLSATNIHRIKRQTSQARADTVADLVASEPDETWIIWCDTDYEAASLKAVLPSAIEVKGSQTIDEKEARLEAFGTGRERILIAKPSMCGFGLDWSHCARMAFVGRSYSYETWYQAVRRCWRFGQKRTVVVHIAVAEGETDIGTVIDRKAGDHAKMKSSMRESMVRAKSKDQSRSIAYLGANERELPSWL